MCKPKESRDATAPEAPYDAASLWSRLTYRYALPLFRKGVRKPLQIDDLPSIAARDELKAVTRRIVAAWEAERRKPRPSLPWALMRCMRQDLIVSGFLFLLDFGALVAQAALLRPFVNWLARSTGDAGGGFWRAALIVLAGLVNLFAHHAAFFEAMRMGWNLRLGMTVALQQKLLRTRSSEVSRVTTGFVVSLVTNDAQRFDNLLPFLHAPWVSFILIVVAYFLISNIVGYAAAAAGLGVLLFSVGIQARLGFEFKRLRAKTAAYTDSRVRLISELLNGILSVKAFAWEKPCLEAVAAARKKEASTVLRAQWCRSLTAALYFSTTALAVFATYAVFFRVRPGESLSVGDVTSLVALLNALRQIVSFGCAYFAMAGPECLVAVRRMQRFLELDECIRTPVPVDNKLLDATNATVAWPRQAPAVSQATCSVQPGQVIVIAGPVGCGKSSLLQAALGELDVTRGALTSTRDVVYAPQSAWIFSGTLLENVTLGSSKVDMDAFAKAVDACALRVDLENLEHGAQTLLGERGVNLSGGQKARVGLARCVYASEISLGSSLALLDDPLAAVDPAVGKHLLDACVFGALKRCGVVLATHSRQCLQRADAVLVLDVSGNVLGFAKWRDLPPAALALVRVDDDDDDDGTVPVAVADVITTTKPAKPDTVQSPAAETREVGDVSLKTWAGYAKRAGWLSISVIAVLFVAGQGLLVYGDFYLLEWSTKENQRNTKYLKTYAVIAACILVVAVARASAFFCWTIKAANVLHNEAVAAVLRAPLWWHHATPRGQVLNRLSQDVGNVDELLAQALFDMTQLGIMMVAVIVTTCVVLPWMCLVLPPLLYVFLRHKRFVGKSMTELKRMEAITKSPAVGRFADTLHGLTATRAFRGEAKAEAALLGALDRNARSWFWWLLSQRYLGFYLDAICVTFLACLLVATILLRDSHRPQVLALALLYSVQLAGTFQWTVRQHALAESFMASVERLVEYGAMAGEDADATGAWAPEAGTIVLEGLGCRYRDDLPPVLRGVSATLRAGSNVGVVGRTGSGKSSLVLALARLNRVDAGRVVIDGVDVASLPLAVLRRALVLVPQEPHLFRGTLRFNLDPWGEHADAALQETLKMLGLDTDLETPVSENGDNLSAGQRQLLCMCRALLVSRRIICVDEATASVDQETDAVIQNVLRTAPQFKRATLIVIAHRIKTIVDSDQILVLDRGQLVEDGPPQDLIARNGAFAEMVRASRSRSATNLRAVGSS